jgi:hypothetical protein
MMLFNKILNRVMSAVGVPVSPGYLTLLPPAVSWV